MTVSQLIGRILKDCLLSVYKRANLTCLFQQAASTISGAVRYRKFLSRVEHVLMQPIKEITTDFICVNSSNF